MNPAAKATLAQIRQMFSSDPLFRDLMDGRLPSSQTAQFEPAADVYTLKDSYVVLIDLPGVAREDVNVRLEGDKLIVEGNRGPAPALDPGTRTNHERRWETFSRVFQLPLMLDAPEVSATLESGVLTVMLPKLEGGGRTVPVQ